MSWCDIVAQHGLKISEVRISELEDTFRLDAEYYSPEHLENDRKIERKGYELLVGLTSKIDVGFVGSMVSEYVDDGIPLLQTQNVQEFFLNMSDCKHVNHEFHRKLKKSQIRKGDILIARSGSFGKASIYLEDETINSSDIIIVEATNEKINPFYLVAFLNGLYGRFQLYRFASGGLQGHVNLTILEKLKIVIPSHKLQESIEKTVKLAYKLKIDAESQFKNAENLLLQELGIADYRPTEKNISIRSVIEATQANRFDAEYWQPKYYEIIGRIKAYKGGYDTLPDLVDVSDQLEKIDPEKEYGYVELADVDTITGGVSNITTMKGSELPSRARMKLKQNDVIVSSVEGSLNKVALISNKINNVLGSTGFFVFRGQTIKPEVLLVMLKSAPFQTILKREAQGTILSAIPKSSLKRIFLPELAIATQNIIVEKIRRAQELDTEAKTLIYRAKHAVEVFIEEDENAALKVIAGA